jgi:hypothetical protein
VVGGVGVVVTMDSIPCMAGAVATLAGQCIDPVPQGLGGDPVAARAAAQETPTHLVLGAGAHHRAISPLVGAHSH